MNYFTHYANHGFSVLPIRRDGTKAPAVNAWSQYRIECADEATLERWHAEGHGVALIGGDVSGGLEIIDIDDPSLVRPFIDAVCEVDASLVSRVAFVATPRQDPETGRHGCHVLYRCNTPEGNQKLAMSEPMPVIEDGEHQRNPITDKPLYHTDTLIETRGEGGYVLAVGCPAECHPSGGVYRHQWGCELSDLTKLTDRERDALHQAARSFDRGVVELHTNNTHEHDSDSPGNVFASVTSWDEILTPHGWRKCGESSGTTRWARPGKDHGWSATTGLVSRTGNDLLCVFSTNAMPFEGSTTGQKCSTHSKFDAYTRLNFDGDYSAAAKHLAGLGHGKVNTSQPAKPITMETWEHATNLFIDELTQGGLAVLETGIGALDSAVGGMAYGEVVIIGGAPSHGKTMLALQAADRFSVEGVSSLLLNEEMSFNMLAKRRLQMMTDRAEEAWEELADTLAAEHDNWSRMRAPVYLSPPCGQVQAAIDRMAWAHENGIRVVVIDYAQLLRGSGESRYEQVSDVSQRIREATSRFGCLTILAAQLNRSSRRNQDRPRSIDLRDSGQLEQDADMILMIDRPYLRGCEDRPYDDFDVFVEKNRNRETRKTEINLKVDLRRQTIAEKSIGDFSFDPAQWEP